MKNMNCKLLKILLLNLCIIYSSIVHAQQLKAKVISITLPNGKTKKIANAPKNNQYDRTLLNLRAKARKLPGSKGSPSPSPSPAPAPAPAPPPAVNCAGSWSSWSTCSGSTQSRTYTVTTQPSNGGTACPSSPESQSCTGNPVNCAGSWSTWSTCSSNSQSRTYTISTQPSNGGTACPSSPETQFCGTTTASPTIASPTTASSGTSSQALVQTSKQVINWDYMVPAGAKWFNVSEMPLVHCEIGQTVEISWTNTNIQHDVHEVYSYPTYIDCDFSIGAKRTDVGNSGNFTFKCETMGTRFFSCNVGKACSEGKQRIRVHGIDTRKTSSISQAGGSTLAEYMKASVKVYKGDTTAIPESNANTLEQMLLSIASNSPLSCSDWLIPSHLSNTTCLGYVYTDLGVLYRQRASSDLDKSKMYYDKALQLIPNFCLAESYLVELQMKKNNKAAADKQFEIACKACGKSDLDMEIIRMAYQEKGWSLPASSDCNPSKQNIVVNEKSKKSKDNSRNETEDLMSIGSDIYKNMGFHGSNVFYGYIYFVCLWSSLIFMNF